MVKTYTNWFIKTRDWKKNDWRNWVAEEYEKLKTSPWTLKNYPQLKDTSFEDLVNMPLTSNYIEAPDDFPTVLRYESTGTVERKMIKLSRNDANKAILGIGRNIWLIRGEPKFKNALMMGSLGLASEAFMNYVSYVIARNAIFIEGGKWRDNVEKIIRRKPYDLIGAPLPYYYDFLKNFDHDIYYDLTFWIGSGDVMTTKIRKTVINKGASLGKLFYPVDTYGASECILLGMEIPPEVVEAVQYSPETNILLIKKENGELINIFDAKPGDVGEVIITPLFDYMVPNYPLNDIIEVITGESKFGLPTFRIIGRRGIPVDVELNTLGRIKGYFSMYPRILGIIIDGKRINDLLGKEFDTESIILIKEKEGKISVLIYVERDISTEEFIERLKNSKDIKYLYDDIQNGLIELELIKDPEVIEEISNYYYNKFGSQTTVPRAIILTRD